jgi:hypothetical protein
MRPETKCDKSVLGQYKFVCSWSGLFSVMLVCDKSNSKYLCLDDIP